MATADFCMAYVAGKVWKEKTAMQGSSTERGHGRGRRGKDNYNGVGGAVPAGEETGKPRSRRPACFFFFFLGTSVENTKKEIQIHPSPGAAAASEDSLMCSSDGNSRRS